MVSSGAVGPGPYLGLGRAEGEGRPGPCCQPDSCLSTACGQRGPGPPEPQEGNTMPGVKYLGINYLKRQNLYFKNYKTLMKEIEAVTNRWKNTLSSWIGRINLLK